MQALAEGWMRMFGFVSLLLWLTAGAAMAVGDDAWDWYTAMTPYEQCMDYLNGDPAIEKILAEDFSDCADLWGEAE